MPFPKTGVYKRLKEEKRLLSEKWWLDSGYPYGRIAFIPKDQTPDELSMKCAEARKSFFQWGSILKRGFAQFKRNHDLGMFIIFLTQNFNLKNEVYEKYDLPYAENLDELPK